MTHPLASVVIDGHEFAVPQTALGGCPRADVPDTTRRARRRGDVPTSPAST